MDCKLSSGDTLCPLQLNMAKNTESILEGFIEGPLHFPPTYKFDVGTHTYDTRFVVVLVPNSLTHPATYFFQLLLLFQLIRFLVSFCIPQCQEEETGLDRPHPVAPASHRLPCPYPHCSAAAGSHLLAGRGHQSDAARVQESHGLHHQRPQARVGRVLPACESKTSRSLDSLDLVYTKSS